MNGPVEEKRDRKDIRSSVYATLSITAFTAAAWMAAVGLTRNKESSSDRAGAHQPPVARAESFEQLNMPPLHVYKSGDKPYEPSSQHRKDIADARLFDPELLKAVQEMEARNASLTRQLVGDLKAGNADLRAANEDLRALKGQLEALNAEFANITGPMYFSTDVFQRIDSIIASKSASDRVRDLARNLNNDVLLAVRGDQLKDLRVDEFSVEFIASGLVFAAAELANIPHPAYRERVVKSTTTLLLKLSIMK